MVDLKRLNPKAAVDSTSSDYDASLPYWQMVRTMMSGTDAMRKAGEKYLPKFESESFPEYNKRRYAARYTNIFADIVKNLSSQPFSKEVEILKASTAIESMLENIDGQNNHVQIFLADWLLGAITTGIHWCLVDYAKVNPFVTDASGQSRRRSVAEERQVGARPYALLVKPEDLLAVYSGTINGMEKIVHARIRETYKIRDVWEEVQVERIRVFDREPIYNEQLDIVGYKSAFFQLWERKDKQSWTVIEEGPISIGEIPLVALVIGERTEGWQVLADLKDCAYLQLEYYEQENGLKNIKTLTAFPMLSADGVNPQIDQKTQKIIKAPVGPRAVLYGGAPSQGNTTGGSWKWIEPAGSSLTFLKDDLAQLAKELRELGRQPLTADSQNLTKETTQFAKAKGKAGIRRWAANLKDAAENVLMYMAMWAQVIAEPEIVLNLDDINDGGDDQTFDDVLGMYDKLIVSKQTVRIEAKRRNILSDSFDPDTEDAQIVDEQPDEPTNQDLLDAIITPPGENSPPDNGDPLVPEG